MPTHPRKTQPCPGCGVEGASVFNQTESLPQIGRVWECSECGEELYRYDNSSHGKGQSYVWRPVRQHMRVNLRFFDAVGDWPDSELDHLYKQGLERIEAIDYYIIDTTDLTQSEWASLTSRTQPTVSESVSKASRKLSTE